MTDVKQHSWVTNSVFNLWSEGYKAICLTNYLFKSNPAAMGVTTICTIFETIPFTSTGNLLPISNNDKNGVTKTAVAVDSDVMTMLSGAISGSVKNVA